MSDAANLSPRPLGKLGREPLTDVLPAAGDHDVGAIPHRRCGDRRAQALRPTADEGDLAVEQCVAELRHD